MAARGARVNGRHAGRIVARSTQGRPRPCGCFLIVSRVPASVLFCLVIAIADGDTLTARCGPPSAPRKMHVRIAAIDAPERRQAYGERARQHLVSLCYRQRAAIQPLNKDAYGRTVAHVRCRSTDVNAAQVRAGMAWVYTPYAKDFPQLAPLQRQARAQGRGLWSQRRPMPPWEYRHRYATARSKP